MGLRDPRFRRELFLRVGVMSIFTAAAFFFLHAGIWVWLFPLSIAAFVVVKWAIRPPEETDADQGKDVSKES